MKLMPIAMIALGTKRVHQNSGEFFLNVEVSVPVVMIISLSSLSPSLEQLSCRGNIQKQQTRSQSQRCKAA
jgi:hypothetical protein